MKMIDISRSDGSPLHRLFEVPDAYRVTGCLGQRFIGAGVGRGTSLELIGTPGNALCAYLNGAEVQVFGNGQDAVGDTMNSGRIVIHGDVGDTLGYAMRGGEIYIRGNAGYRVGVHMKSYRQHVPVIVIGGCAGSFLGEYQAGGVILVLGLDAGGKPIAGDFPCTGMHGGRVILRGTPEELRLPPQVTASTVSPADSEMLRCHIEEYCRLFGRDPAGLLEAVYTEIVPDSSNPYHPMYVSN